MDSVELVMEFEEYFRICIPDPDAEKLTTVGEVVDYVCSRLGISQEDNGWLDTQLSKLISAIAYLGYTAEGLNHKTSLYQCCNPSDKVEWQVLSETFGMSIPNPMQEALVPGSFKRIFRQPAWQPRIKPESVTLEQLLVATAAHNLHRIVKPGNISTRLQVYAAVMRITTDKTGVDYFEISPSASFTNDLGVD